MELAVVEVVKLPEFVNGIVAEKQMEMNVVQNN